MKLLEMLAPLVYPQARNIMIALEKLLRENLIPLLDRNKSLKHRTKLSEHIVDAISRIEEPEIIEFLSILYKALARHYKLYTQQNAIMDFSGFTRFCADYSIFPDLINKTVLYASSSI